MPYLAEEELEDEARIFADTEVQAPQRAAPFVEVDEEPAPEAHPEPTREPQRAPEPEPEPEVMAEEEPMAEPVAEPEAGTLAEPATEPTTAPTAEQIPDPATEPMAEPLAEDGAEDIADPVRDPAANPMPASAEAAPGVIAMPPPSHDAVSYDDEEEDIDAPPPMFTPHRPMMDDSVQSVLREEAERESRARLAERASIETQPDLGLTPAPVRTAPEPASGTSYLEQMRAFEDEDDQAAAANSKAARRDLLPDIEEINSTLRATSERGRTPGAISPLSSPVEHRRGFRLGFSLVLLVAAALLAVYTMAPTIEARAPAYAGMVQSYVASVDVLRGWLNDGLQAAVRMINGSKA